MLYTVVGLYILRSVHASREEEEERTLREIIKDPFTEEYGMDKWIRPTPENSSCRRLEDEDDRYWGELRLWDPETGLPSEFDVKQTADTCYINSVLASLAIRQPDLIKKMIRHSPDKPGHYEVDLQVPRPDVKSPITTVVVDDYFPIRTVTKFKNRFKKRRDEAHYFWPVIIEKAIAKFFGGYDKINHTGKIDEILKLLIAAPTICWRNTGEDGYNAGDCRLTIEQIEQYISSPDCIVIAGLHPEEGSKKCAHALAAYPTLISDPGNTEKSVQLFDPMNLDTYDARTARICTRGAGSYHPMNKIIMAGKVKVPLKTFLEHHSLVVSLCGFERRLIEYGQVPGAGYQICSSSPETVVVGFHEEDKGYKEFSRNGEMWRGTTVSHFVQNGPRARSSFSMCFSRPLITFSEIHNPAGKMIFPATVPRESRKNAIGQLTARLCKSDSDSDTHATAVSIYVRRGSNIRISLRPAPSSFESDDARLDYFRNRLRNGILVKKYQRTGSSRGEKFYRQIRFDSDSLSLRWRKLGLGILQSELRVNDITSVRAVRLSDIKRAGYNGWDLKIEYGDDELSLGLPYNEDPRFWASMLLKLRSAQAPTDI